MTLSHKEHLQAADTLHFELGVERDRLLAQCEALVAKNTELVTAATALEAEIVKLNEEIARLKETAPPEPEPVPDPVTYLWNDPFTTAPDDVRYVRAGANPNQNFLLVPGGGLDCVFTTGFSGGPYGQLPDDKVLRSELMIRVPGTNNHWRESVGKTYLDEFAFTVPTDFKPSKANEPVLCYQHWQAQEFKPPTQLQLIDPALTPDPFILRLLLSSPLGKERHVWKRPIEKGRRYKVALRTHWSPGVSGRLELFLDDQLEFTLSGATCYDAANGMAPHLGQYHPGSGDEAAGIKTTLKFGYWRIREL